MAERKTVDAHHHLWKYTVEEYGWISDEMGILRRDFLPADLRQAMRSAGVDGAVAVQARQSVAETDWLLELAEKDEAMLGVVGWLPLQDEGFAELLQRYQGRNKLKGLRHVVQDEPDDFLLGTEFNRGVRAMQGTDLVYDILIHERHLPQAAEFVAMHPEQVFVLDHLAKPRIREAFGAERLMAGSDWPVCLVASGYERWWEALRAWAAPLSTVERGAIFGETAKRVYRLG
jgi:L-fuconolactonase